jgi:type I restriction enzyme M protein
VVLANGSMSSNQNNKGEIRRRMVEGDVVECMVALPPQLFLNTQIPACLWLLTRDKTEHGRDRRGEILFIDARKLGYMETRVNRVFADADVKKIAETVYRWRQNGEIGGVYEDLAGFCRAVKLEEVREHGYVLTPGRFIASDYVEEDTETFIDKMERLTTLLSEQTTKGRVLDGSIGEIMGKLGYGV